MSLIEGVGDEVTHFFIVVIVLLVGWLAWYSTSITDQPLIRTVLVLHRTGSRLAELRANLPNVSTFTRPPNLEVTEEETIQQIANDNNSNSQSCPEPSVAGDIPYSKATFKKNMMEILGTIYCLS